MGLTFMESFREISRTVSKIDFGEGKALKEEIYIELEILYQLNIKRKVLAVHCK